MSGRKDRDAQRADLLAEVRRVVEIEQGRWSSGLARTACADILARLEKL